MYMDQNVTFMGESNMFKQFFLLYQTLFNVIPRALLRFMAILLYVC